MAISLSSSPLQLSHSSSISSFTSCMVCTLHFSPFKSKHWTATFSWTKSKTSKMNVEYITLVAFLHKQSPFSNPTRHVLCLNESAYQCTSHKPHHYLCIVSPHFFLTSNHALCYPANVWTTSSVNCSVTFAFPCCHPQDSQNTCLQWFQTAQFS